MAFSYYDINMFYYFHMKLSKGKSNEEKQYILISQMMKEMK